MILIPEIEAVVILVPRTGTSSLRRAIENKYPRSMMLYRHMEADGVPHGYDRWTKFGVCRNPIDRLWSLFKFQRDIVGHRTDASDYQNKLRESVLQSFSQWILHNEVVFTDPYDSAGLGRYYPLYSNRHSIPENRKSQFIHLRPDLGTVVYAYDCVDKLHEMLQVEPEDWHNRTPNDPPPTLSDSAKDYIERRFKWDFENSVSPHPRGA